jgi:hypothetical protein
LRSASDGHCPHAEALERVKKGLQSLLGRGGNGQKEQLTSPRLAKLQDEAEELRTLEKQGRLSKLAARAALDAIDFERAELGSRLLRSS